MNIAGSLPLHSMAFAQTFGLAPTAEGRNLQSLPALQLASAKRLRSGTWKKSQSLPHLQLPFMKLKQTLASGLQEGDLPVRFATTSLLMGSLVLGGELLPSAPFPLLSLFRDPSGVDERLPPPLPPAAGPLSASERWCLHWAP